MRREPSTPRADWPWRCEEVGFAFHSLGGSTYWDESACYAFAADEVDRLEAATEELNQLCLEACGEVIRNQRYREFAIPQGFESLIADSWEREEPSLYGRFDLAWTGEGAPKLLEYNADTPTALLEASVVQWFWLQDLHRERDQFNSLHEKLIERWKEIVEAGTVVHFACVRDNEEDLGTIEYLRDTATQAGLDARRIFIEDIGWSEQDGAFADLDNAPIDTIFKLYPWEWLARERFGENLLRRSARWIEPPWKMLLSNKALLALLWELHPGHPNLLPCFFEAGRIQGDYVRKPLLSREGANISLRRPAQALSTGGTYGAEGYVYQAYAPLAHFDGSYAVIGSWIVGEEAAGIGVREDDSPITRNTSRFVPHYFD